MKANTASVERDDVAPARDGALKARRGEQDARQARAVHLALDRPPPPATASEKTSSATLPYFIACAASHGAFIIETINNTKEDRPGMSRANEPQIDGNRKPSAQTIAPPPTPGGETPEKPRAGS